MAVCENPFMVDSFPAPCGKCIPCKKNRKRTKVDRLILESYAHEHSAFITLTYNDDNLRFQNEKTGEFTLPNVVPSDLKNFIKRLRRAVAPQKLRFFAVGEYGDDSWRPHYHLLLFGYPPCHRGGTRLDLHAKGRSCCPPCDLLKEKWSHPKTKQPYGSIENLQILPERIAYVCGYTNKKMTNPKDGRLQGRHPEFFRASNRPGIGAVQIDKIADALLSEHGEHALTEHGDVPVFLNLGERKIKLDRYMRNKIRERVQDPLNFGEIVDPYTGEIKSAPKEKAKEAFRQELLLMYRNFLNDPKIPKSKKAGIKSFISHRDNQKILNIKSRHKLSKRRKKI